MKRIFLFLLFISLNTAAVIGQKADEDKSPPSTKNEIEQELKRNRRKTKINGAYIPKDINDAIVQLEKLSEGKSLDKFKNAPEDIVAKKLHFGLGRWMIVNWNFYGGSRFEKVLRDMELGHPDDMADFMITIFHRHLNHKPLNPDELAKEFKKKRLEKHKKKKREILKILKK